jgi:hypothetical protein
MVILDEGLTRVAELHASDIAQGQWGIGTAVPAPSDTGLGSAVVSTLLNVTGSSSGNSAQFTHTVPSTSGNGVDLTEFELRFGNGDSLNRTVGGAISKTSSFDLTTITTVSFVRG